MNGEGQRPPAPPDTAQASTDAPEPGNARYPQPGMNGNANANVQFGPGQEAQGGGRRRFRRNRRGGRGRRGKGRSEEHTSELQSHSDLVCRLLLEKKKRDSGATGAPEAAL